MALVKYGAVVTEASGSLDGVTYSRNTFGAYVRARAVPVNPNTPAQTAARTLLTGLSQAWRTLSSSERNAWSVVAASITRQNALGESYNPTGQQLYVGTNINRQLIGLSVASSPPTPDAAPELLELGFAGAANAPGPLEISWSDIVGTGTFLVYVTPPVSAGINFYRSSLYRLLTTFDQSETDPYDIYTEYDSLFPLGPDKSGSSVGLRLRPISDSGYAGTDVTARTILA